MIPQRFERHRWLPFFFFKSGYACFVTEFDGEMPMQLFTSSYSKTAKLGFPNFSTALAPISISPLRFSVTCSSFKTSFGPIVNSFQFFIMMWNSVSQVKQKVKGKNSDQFSLRLDVNRRSVSRRWWIAGEGQSAGGDGTGSGDRGWRQWKKPLFDREATKITEKSTFDQSCK